MKGTHNIRSLVKLELVSGIGIREAGEELIRVGTLLGCGAQADFNNVEIYAYPFTTVEEVVNTYQRLLTRARQET